jgi:hypothetical protein
VHERMGEALAALRLPVRALAPHGPSRRLPPTVGVPGVGACCGGAGHDKERHSSSAPLLREPALLRLTLPPQGGRVGRSSATRGCTRAPRFAFRHSLLLLFLLCWCVPPFGRYP